MSLGKTLLYCKKKKNNKRSHCVESSRSFHSQNGKFSLNHHSVDEQVAEGQLKFSLQGFPLRTVSWGVNNREVAGESVAHAAFFVRALTPPVFPVFFQT
jgi:hypothetical protein